MSRKQGKRRHGFLMALAIIIIIAIGGYFFLVTHTQIIVGAVQKLSQGTVNTKNLFSPLGDPTEGVKENGQYIMTEIKYSDVYPNSYLDITYPNADKAEQRPTLIYFHGGGFFGGSKGVGDPLAGSDATALLDDICAEGFNLVNIDYALVPEYHFPVPLIQVNIAFQFLMEHEDEYHLDMNHVVIMGSSAGAIMTSQLGSIITNPAYAQLLEIEPALQPAQVKALVIDDAPLDYEHFPLGTKVLVGNYIRGSIFVSKDEIRRYNNIGWIDANYPPCVLLGSEYHADMRLMDTALTDASVRHELVDPLAERGIEKPHCFVASERVDEVAKDAFDRMIAFIKSELAEYKVANVLIQSPDFLLNITIMVVKCWRRHNPAQQF